MKKIREEEHEEHEKQMGLINQIEQNIQLRIAQARAEAITEFAERLKTFYDHLPGTTVGGAVMFHVDMIAKEMREKQ